MPPIREPPDVKRRTREVNAQDGRASLFGSVLSVANSVIGAGMLSLPYLLRESSVFVGLIVIASTCAISMYSFHIIGACCELTGKFDFRGICDAAGGPTFSTFVQVVMILYTAGACISYGVLLGDFTTGLVGAVDTDYWTLAQPLQRHSSAVMLIGIFILTPLSCIRDLRNLQHSSALALLCDFVTVGVIIYNSATAPIAPDVNWGTASPAVFLVMPIVAIACSTHHNAPKFYEELEQRSLTKMKTLSVGAMGLATFVYLIVSTAGYLQFGGNTKGDILNCYEPTDPLAIAARFCLAVHIALTFPILFNAMRANLHSLLWSKERGESPSLSRRDAALYAVFVVPALAAVAASVPEVHEVLAFNGALLGSLIAYAIPGYIYYCLLEQQNQDPFKIGRVESQDFSQYWAPIGCAAFGLVMMVTGTSSIVMEKLGLISISSSGH